MSTTALGIAPDSDGNGVTPLTHRKVQQYQWASTGVLGGLEVSGGTDLNYTISEGVAVTTRGDSDGYALAYSEGGTVETIAGDSSNPRYDVLWISSHDISQGDDDNLVTLGVTNGSAASSPSIPTIDSDCTAIATMYVPAAMTATSSCTAGDIDYAIPYGASLGLLGAKYQTTNAKMSKSGSNSAGSSSWAWASSSKVTISVPTDRYIECIFDWKGEAVPTSSWSYPELALSGGMWYRLYVDGTWTDTVNGKFMVNTQVVRQQYSEIVKVSKGTHTVQFKTAAVNSKYYDTYWRGIRDTYVFDRGVAS